MKMKDIKKGDYLYIEFVYSKETVMFEVISVNRHPSRMRSISIKDINATYSDTIYGHDFERYKNENVMKRYKTLEQAKIKHLELFI